MAVKPDIVSPADAIVLDRVHGMIHFDHVHAAYEGRPVLHGVNLTVVPGEHVALVGPSGSGKSTLVSLVVRALDPTSGTVSLDGHSLDELDLRFLRSQASVLHQEAVLLTGTIRENIRLGRPDASDEEVEAARARPTPTSSSPRCPAATTRPWASGEAPSPAASASASPLLGRCCVTRRSSSWMRRPPGWTRPRPRRCWKPLMSWWPDARP